MSVVSRLELMGRDVKTRAEWGAKYGNIYLERIREMPVKLPVPFLFQHISVTFDTGVFVGDFYKDMQTLERIGYERFGSGISYNWAVDAKTGMIGEGMPLNAKGTHTVNDKGIPNYPYNLNYFGHAIVVIGMPGVVPSAECVKSMGAIIRAEWDEGVALRNCPYDPHFKFSAKDCPTPNIYYLMDNAYRIAQNWSPFDVLSEEDKTWFRTTMRAILQEVATTQATFNAFYQNPANKALIEKTHLELQIANLRTDEPGDTAGLNTMISRMFQDTEILKDMLRRHHAEPLQEMPQESDL